jgi:hypothetical protein
MNKNKLTSSGIIFVISLVLFFGVYKMGHEKLSNSLAARINVHERFKNIKSDLANFTSFSQRAMEQRQKFQELLGQFENSYMSNQDVISGFQARAVKTASANKITFSKNELSKDGADMTVLTMEFETSYSNLYKFVFDLEMFSEVKSVSVAASGVIKVVASPIVFSSQVDDFFSGRKVTRSEVDSFGYFKDIFDRTEQTYNSIGHIPSWRDLLPAPSRDPFYFLQEKTAAVAKKTGRPVRRSFPKIEVEGIMYDPANPLVVIGEKIYKVGDTIRGAKISRITEHNVTFIFEGQKYTIRIVRED